jgi:2-methylisocitrate lyase-like PEP mutase family enzyme
MFGDRTAADNCGHGIGEQLFSGDDLVAKIKAAVDARIDGDFTILARTDAVAVHGLANAIERAEMCLEAGADWVCLDAPESTGQLRRIPQLLSAPMLARMSPGDRTPVLPAAELQDMGYAAVLWPNAFTLAYAKLTADLASELMRSGTTAAYHDLMAEPDAFDDLLHLPTLSRADDGGGSYKETVFDRAA